MKAPDLWLTVLLASVWHHSSALSSLAGVCVTHPSILFASCPTSCPLCVPCKGSMYLLSRNLASQSLFLGGVRQLIYIQYHDRYSYNKPTFYQVFLFLLATLRSFVLPCLTLDWLIIFQCSIFLSTNSIVVHSFILLSVISLD